MLTALSVDATKVATIIAEITLAIDRLYERCMASISAAVTGRIGVRKHLLENTLTGEEN